MRTLFLQAPSFDGFMKRRLREGAEFFRFLRERHETAH
jgi:hypothetical protein